MIKPSMEQEPSHHGWSAMRNVNVSWSAGCSALCKIQMAHGSVNLTAISWAEASRLWTTHSWMAKFSSKASGFAVACKWSAELLCHACDAWNQETNVCSASRSDIYKLWVEPLREPAAKSENSGKIYGILPWWHRMNSMVAPEPTCIQSQQLPKVRTDTQISISTDKECWKVSRINHYCGPTPLNSGGGVFPMWFPSPFGLDQCRSIEGY